MDEQGPPTAKWRQINMLREPNLFANEHSTPWCDLAQSSKQTRGGHLPLQPRNTAGELLVGSRGEAIRAVNGDAGRPAKP